MRLLKQHFPAQFLIEKFYIENLIESVRLFNSDKIGSFTVIESNRDNSKTNFRQPLQFEKRQKSAV